MDIINYFVSSFNITCIIVFAAYMLGGIVDSVCGGGGLITVPVLLATGMSPHMAVGTNQCSMLPGIVTSVIKFGKKGRLDWRNSLYAVPFGLLGGFFGAKLNILISERYLQIILLALLPVLAIVSLRQTGIGAEDKSSELPRGRIIIVTMAIGLVIGSYHAFYGPASGLFYMLAFAALLRYDLVTANANGRFITMFVSVLSSLTYGLSGFVYWPYMLFTIVGYALGNYIGATIALSKGARLIRPTYYCILVLLFVKLVKDFFF